MKNFSRCLFAGLLLVSAAHLNAADDPSAVDADYEFQGEYVGTFKEEEGQRKYGAQVIALGNGKFRAVGYVGGLPGDGWNGEKPERVESSLKDGAVHFIGEHGSGLLKDGKISTLDKEGQKVGEMKKVHRKSPTLGAKPPEGALVLFDGSSADHFKPGKMTEDGLLMQGANSKERFQSHKLHIEFRLPYQPTKKGQGRGNSGCYMQGRYEVQMLDSFGLEGKHNECGGIYSIKEPDVNMCFPPLAWQTYDIDFTAAEFDEQGKKTKNARMTVKHNGVVVHNDVELPKSTTASPLKESPEPGFIHLQNHGNPVHYRNIWVVRK